MTIYKEIVKKLDELGYTISTMESCTGGGIASEITNHTGASSVLKFSAVTYSNEYKIKMGVAKQTIEEYSVYSIETAREMAKNISEFANSTYGVGITGKINVPDSNNDIGDDNLIFYCIYDSKEDIYHEYHLNSITNKNREDNKRYIIENIGNELLKIIK